MREPGDQRSETIERQRPPVEVVDSTRPLASPQVWRSASHAAVIGIFGILFIAGLSLAQPVFLPAASAFVITMMLGPISARADRHRIPPLLTALVLWLLVMAVFYGLIILLAKPAVEWIGKAPDIARSVQEKLLVFDRPLSALRDLREALLPADSKKDVGFDIMAIVTPAVGYLTPAIGQVLVFFGVLFFMLLGRNHFRHVLVAVFQGREARLRCLKILNDIEHHLTRYLSVVTIINLTVGVAAGVIAFAVGLPNPIAWGVLGFVLNYIPYIGALMMELAMFLVGLVTFPSLALALLAPLLYLAFATLEGHFITPGIVGRQFTLNPLTVFMALVFWSWLWGPMGAFLAVPLLIIGLVAVVHLFPKHVPELPE